MCDQELEDLWPFRSLLVELTRRLSYCVKAELIPLMEVAGVMEVRTGALMVLVSLMSLMCLYCVLQSRAKQLYDSGYKTLTHLANADPDLLSRTVANLYRKQAVLMVASAKVRQPPAPDSIHISADLRGSFFFSFSRCC